MQMSPWLHKILTDLEQAERRIDDSPELDGELPPWANNVSKWLLQTALPKVPLWKGSAGLGAREVGTLLAYKWLYAALFPEIAARPIAPEVNAGSRVHYLTRTRFFRRSSAMESWRR